MRKNENIIYGVDATKDVTPRMVRDAIIQCYYEADKKVLERLFPESDFDTIDQENETKRKHVEILIKRIFDEVDADFDQPTKESLKHVIDKCKEFASCFRDEEIINKHYSEILGLIERIE